VRELFEASGRTYGSPRIHAELREDGEHVSRKRVARIMREEKIQGVSRRRGYTVTTRPGDEKPATDLVERNFVASGPNELWVADITYLPSSQGWLYLAAVKDLCTRKIVGWALAEHLRAELVCEALRDALRKEGPAPGLIHHSDRGVQYACQDFQELLARHQLTCSMSRRGNCYDNAAMESFWGTFKQELVYPEHFEKKTKEEVRRATFKYIELYYNRNRKHSALGYTSPEQYHQAQTRGQAA